MRRSLAPACLCLGLVVPVAWAELADRQQPMNIEADSLRYDDARQTSVFTGNVVITKGTIVIRGEQIDIRQDDQGNQFGVVRGSPSKRAFFRQKREGLDEFIEGEADRIEYDSLADRVTFTGQAVLRRYRGASLNDETRGARIVYNGTRETFVVEGGAESRSAENPSGRVRTQLGPSAAAGAGTGSPPVPAAPLTPSGRVEPRQ